MPSYDIDDPRNYDELPESKKAALRKWIAMVVRPANTVESQADSYVLKHRFEAAAFYVRNGTFKGAMLAAGYEPLDPRKKNWRFKIRPVRKLEKPYSIGPYEIGHGSEGERAELRRLVAIVLGREEA